jgi:hypothetical protein
MKHHSSSIQALTHTERRVSRVGMNSYWSVFWSVKFFRSEDTIQKISFKISLFWSFIKPFHQTFNLVHLPARSRISYRTRISFDRINKIKIESIESLISSSQKCRKRASNPSNDCLQNNSQDHLSDHLEDHHLDRRFNQQWSNEHLQLSELHQQNEHS